jgi:glyoxalase family protein
MRFLGLDGTADGVRTSVYGLGDRGPGREVEAPEAPEAARHRPGAGGTHHVAFPAPSLEDVDRYATFVVGARLPSSGVIDRTFFQNLYFREPGGTLIEIAAAVPGRSPYAFDAEIGNRLVLPNHLEAQREAIERQLHPLDD